MSAPGKPKKPGKPKSMARRKNPRVDALSVRAVHLEEPNLDKLSELLVRLTLQRAEQSRIDQTARRPAGATRDTSDSTGLSEDPR